MRSTLLIIGAGILLAAAVPGAAGAREKLTGEARLAKILDGRVAGKPVNCISLSHTQSSEVIDGTAIVYRSGGTLYVNRPSNAQDLDGDVILLTRTSIAQLCSVDIVNLIDRTSRFQRGFVALNAFVPYRRVKS